MVLVFGTKGRGNRGFQRIIDFNEQCPVYTVMGQEELEDGRKGRQPVCRLPQKLTRRSPVEKPDCIVPGCSFSVERSVFHPVVDKAGGINLTFRTRFHGFPSEKATDRIWKYEGTTRFFLAGGVLLARSTCGFGLQDEMPGSIGAGFEYVGRSEEDPQ
jgi:hypothetical protein